MPFVPPVMDCPMVEVLAALRGEALPPDPRVLLPPPELNGRSSGPSGPGGKEIYGGHLAHYLDTENFTINWDSKEVSQDAAELAAQALETVWRRMVEEEGWQQPVSSDRYLLWILLDPTLGGTGFTTEYFTDDYPQGYPVIYLNPSWASSPDFFTSLSYHEFHHALQYAVREYTGGASEAWYWEASAEWGAELTRPELDGNTYTVAWYSDNPWLAYDTVNASHEYGMQVLNSWVDEIGHGAGGMQSVWEAARGVDTSWIELLAATLDLSTEEIWGGFTGAMGNNLFTNSPGYDDVWLEGDLQEGSSGSAEELGTRYFRVRDDALVSLRSVEGSVILSGPSSTSPESLLVSAGDILAVTATSSGGASFTLGLEDPPIDTGGPGDTDTPEDTDSTSGPPNAKEGSCGCAQGSSAGAGGILALCGLLAFTRARSARTSWRRRSVLAALSLFLMACTPKTEDTSSKDTEPLDTSDTVDTQDSDTDTGGCVDDTDSGHTGDSTDTGDTEDSSDTDDTSDTSDTQDTSDTGDTAEPGPCPPEMALAGAVCIDRYEASHPDATESWAGVDSSYASSRAGVQPWRETSNTLATAACEAAGKRLCTAAEWQQSCEGPDETLYPYGDTYDAAICNGIDTFCKCEPPYAGCYVECGGSYGVLPTGAMEGCLNEYGLYDMSGNLWEHVQGSGSKALRGGAYNCGDSASNHLCSFTPTWTPSALGFRCCVEPSLDQSLLLP